MYGCETSDPPTSHLELPMRSWSNNQQSKLEVYLEFYDVCAAGEYKIAGTLKENAFLDYNIYDSERIVQVPILK
uniref:Uncharacterized protein n=1 Tax=Panagrolaimus sp. ES5 TaxID=591445 RepID=A0AC34FWC5_9BILA